MLLRARAMWRLLRSPRSVRFLVPIAGAIPVIAILFYAADAVKVLEERVVRFFAFRSEPADSIVRVVELDDSDLREVFASTRPLPAEKLTALLLAIAELKARAIGVDIHTSDKEYAKLAEQRWPVPVVWGRTATFSHRDRTFYPESALAGADLSRPGLKTGLMLLPPDDDGRIRKYMRFFPLPKAWPGGGGCPDQHGELLLPIAVREAAGLSRCAQTGERFINFYGHTSGRHRRPVSARGVFEQLDTYRTLRENNDPSSKDAEIFRDKLVLVGIKYGGVDQLETPLGWMNGVQLLAQIAETDETNVEPTEHRAIQVLIVVAAFAVAASFSMMRAGTAASISLAALTIASVSLWWFTRSFRDPLLLFAVCIAVLGQQLYRKASEYLKKLPDKVPQPAGQLDHDHADLDRAAIKETR